MKLLKFVNCDAPQTFSGAELTPHRLSFPSHKAHADTAKAWVLQAASPAAHGGGYWLLDDDNKPIGILNDVLLAVPAGEQAATCISVPCGVVADHDIKELDFRSKLGRQLERSRAEYGVTFKTAAKSARALMDAAEITEKRHEKMKREREAVVEAIEAGESAVNPTKAKRAKAQAK